MTDLSPREIAQRIVDDHRTRMICLKPEYDSVDLGEALIMRAIERALSRPITPPSDDIDTIDAARLAVAREDFEERARRVRQKLGAASAPPPPLSSQDGEGG
jgi:hypothetical protein